MYKYKGYLCIVLHAHIPFIRHPEYEYFLEENWLYEAITETYIPFIDLIDQLLNDGTNFKLTLSLSPPLIEMLNDALLKERYQRYLNRLIELAKKEAHRTKGDLYFEPIVKMYNKKLKRVKHLYEETYKRDIISAFKRLQDSHKIQIITSAATHAFLPNLSIYPQAVRVQIKIGTEVYQKNFGCKPKGMWLPECGFIQGFDQYIKESGMKYFFLEAHGIVHGTPLPQLSIYVPIRCPSGVFAFGRDPKSSKQVWSSKEGYPGDSYYRDFYRDIGYDLDIKYIKSHIYPYNIRTFTGLKYYRITGKTDHKKPYILHKAKKKAKEHAEDFIKKKAVQIDFLSELFKSQNLPFKPVITAIYDAELFGHWWFEGLDWLKFFLQKSNRNHANFTMVTPSGYLNSQNFCIKNLSVCQPSMSSWGEKGYNDVWLNKSNDYFYRHMLKATERMLYLAKRFPKAKGILKRALNQAARELLLSQHSDWAFMINTGTCSNYAKMRFKEHINIFDKIYDSIMRNSIPYEWLSAIENKDNIFKDIDYRIFKEE